MHLLTKICHLFATLISKLLYISGWTNTYDRARTFRFSDDFEKPVLNALWIKKGGSLPSFPDLAGLKIGFNDGWQADEHCLSRYSDLLRVSTVYGSQYTLWWSFLTNRDPRARSGAPKNRSGPWKQIAYTSAPYPAYDGPLPYPLFFGIQNWITQRSVLKSKLYLILKV